MEIDRNLHVGVMVVTCRRPAMVSRLLSAFARLVVPEQTTVSFIVVDNDALGSARPLCEQFNRSLKANRAYYVLEPVQSIPLARNRALDKAVGIDADLGAFIDDDEIPDPGWLEELVRTFRNRHVELIGGPVRPVAWDDLSELTFWQKLLLDGVQRRYRRKERRAARITANGADDTIVVVTNNWMIDMRWWRESQLRFDESLRYTGGSDALFFQHAKRLGVKSAWCPTAVVSESVPKTRLSLRYQFSRARSQATSSFYRKYTSRSAAVAAITLVSCGLKLAGACASVIAIAFLPGFALVQSARALGWTCGRVHALFGGISTQYQSIDGA